MIFQVSRDTWKTLNSLIQYNKNSKDIILSHNGTTVSDSSAIAKVFNNYFSNVASNLDRNIPHSIISPLNFMGAPVENSFFCPPSDREEIVNLIRWQKNNPLTSWIFPVFIYKILAPIISPTVSMLFNYSLSEVLFLNASKQLKIFKFLIQVTQILLWIIDVFIFMLPFLSKIFEKLMCARLDSYLNWKIFYVQISLASAKIQIPQTLLLNSVIMFIHH